MIELSAQDLETVRRILAAHVPELEARAFGSRVSGGAGPHADLDLTLVGEGPLDQRRLEALKDAFSESDLPFSVDVLDWNALSNAFRKAIEAGWVALQKAGANHHA